MSVSIEDVLALLPELFPGIQLINLTKIRPNPKNHGRRLTLPEIQVLADNIVKVGLVNAIKVWADRNNPLASGVQLHPDNPRLRGDGQPWSLDDFNWEILAGENRYRAFDLLKREKIPGYILNPAPQEINRIMWLDNDVRERGWWAAYQAIEMEIESNPNLTMQEVADNLKMDRDKVSRALRLLPLLGPKTRDLICGVSAFKNKGILDLGEMATARLGDLGPYTPYKPGSWKRAIAQGQDPPKLWPYPLIPPETQELVHWAMVVAGEHDMSESQVKALVAHIKSGGQPEDYKPEVKPPKKKAPAEGGSGIVPEGSDSTTESALPKNVSQPASGQRPQAEGQDLSEPIPEQGMGNKTQGIGTPNTVPQPLVVTPEPEPKAASQNFWQELVNDLKEVFQGFSAAAIKDALGKIPRDNKWQAMGYILEKFIKAGFFKFFHLVGVLLKHLGRLIYKSIHGIAKAGANQFAPLGSRTSGQSHSYRSHLSQTPLKALGHGAVYLFFSLFCYSTLLSMIGSFTPFIGPWVQAHVIELAHWLVSLLLGAAWNTLQNPLWFFGACLILLIWIHKTFKPGYGGILFTAIVLVALWFFKGWIMDELHISLPSAEVHAIEVPKIAVPTLAPISPVPPTTEPVKTVKLPARNLAHANKKAAPAPKVEVSNINQAPTVVPANEEMMKERLASDTTFALDFVQAVYNIGFRNTGDMDYFKKWVKPVYAQAFLNAYFPQKKIFGVVEQKLTQTLIDPKVILLKSDETTDDFRVTGTLQTECELNPRKPLSTRKPLAVEIHLVHSLDMQGLVSGLKEIE